jgi:hypothetical protein
VQIPDQTFRLAVKTMRECGDGRRECVVFLVEKAETGVLDVVHPVHSAGRGGYEVDQDWLGRFAVRQIEEPQSIRAQIHTHPGEAFHSSIDDEWPIGGTAGFISIVVPRFGRGTFEPHEIYACRLTSDGAWEPVDPASLFVA